MTNFYPKSGEIISDTWRKNVRVPFVGEKVKLLHEFPEVKIGNKILMRGFKKGEIGEVVKISYPIVGGAPDTTIHVKFDNEREIKKPMLNNIYSPRQPFTFWESFEII